VESGPYGHETYHPIWSVLGDINNPGLILPKLVQYIRAYKDRKVKLDINDYSLIFFSIFNSTPPTIISSKMLKLIERLQEKINHPLLDGLEMKSFIEQEGFASAKPLAAQFSKSGFRVHSVFERAVVGLSHYILDFPFPHHYKITFQGAPITQNFLTGGRDYIQEIMMNLPSDLDWKVLAAKVHPESQIYRLTLFRTPHQTLFRFFHLASQNWVVPWENVAQEWTTFLEQNTDETPFLPDFEYITPNEEIIKVMELLEENALYLNSELSVKTKIPLETIEEYRKTLEEHVLAYRNIIPYFRDLCVINVVDIQGIETWKYQLLAKIAEVFPAFYISHLENLRTSENSLRAIFVHTPHNSNIFIKHFAQTFQGVFPYKLHQLYQRFKFLIPFHNIFDPATGTWKFEPRDYSIQPMRFPNREP